MSLFEELLNVYPHLTSDDFNPKTGKVLLKDDGDGIVYLAEWNLSQPIPEGFKLGK